jgi:hypothetical protein
MKMNVLAPRQLAPWSAICIGDSHCLKYTGKRIAFSDNTAVQFASAYISGFSSLSLQRKSTPPAIGPSEMSGYALKLLQSLGALSFENNGLSQAESAQDAAVAYAKLAPLISPLVIITCGDIDLRSTVMRIGLEDPIYSTTIQATFQGLLGFVADLKRRGVNIVLEGLTPPTHDDTIFLLHNKFLLPPEIRGRMYLDCNKHIREECGKLGIMYLDLSVLFSSSLGCLKDEFEHDGVHLYPSSVEVMATHLEALFQHSPVNYSRYRFLLEKRSTTLIPRPEDADLKTSARSSFLKNSILVNCDHDPLVHELLNAIYSRLTFSQSVANLHYRFDWAGNERKAFSEHIRYSPVSQAHLDIVYQLIYRTCIIHFVGDALGFDPCIYAYRPLRSTVHNDDGVGPQSYHHDGCPPGIYRMLIYLSDVDTESGPFCYHLSNGLIQEVHGDFGTVILFDANKLWHSAKPPQSRERTALDFCIGPRHEQSDQFVIAPGMNNWPCDPFLFSVHDMVVSPPNNRRFFSFSPYPVKTEIPTSLQVNR